MSLNRKILGICVVLLAVAMLATPVLAAPTNGQKVPITIHFANQQTTYTSEEITGNVIHRTADVTYDIAIDVDGVPTYTGTASALRNILIVPREVGVDLVLQDDYVFMIDDEEGTFEGSALILLKGYIAPTQTTPPDYERGKAHALLQGTGGFEGQTINAGHHWVPFGAISWSGYLLKP